VSRAALEKYGQHLDGCPRYGESNAGYGCTCGLSAALSAPEASGAQEVERIMGLIAGYALRYEHGEPVEPIRTAVTTLAARAERADDGRFQAGVDAWMRECFGDEIARDKMERNHRFLEEALELVQANGCTQSESHQLVDYVYGRDQGEINQEVGGVMVTLAALCSASGVSMELAGETELARVWTKIEKIRAKQAAKPKCSPLPEQSALARVTGELAEARADAATMLMRATCYEELERARDDWKRRAENHAETLRGIASMHPATESERMRQWAMDGLSGYSMSIQSTLKRLQDELAAERTAAARMREALEFAANARPERVDREPIYHWHDKPTSHWKAQAFKPSERELFDPEPVLPCNCYDGDTPASANEAAPRRETGA